MANRQGNNGKSDRLYFHWLHNQRMVTATMKLKYTFSLEEKLRQHVKKQRCHFANKGHYSPIYVCLFFFFFPVVMYGCEIWIIKKAEHQRSDAFICGVGEDS